MILETLLNKKATDIKTDATKFSDEHPVAMGLILGLSAVIFAQHIELKCYQIVAASRR